MYYTWAPVLASTRIHVATKIRLLNTYLRPVMEYAAEIWGIPLHVDDNASLREFDTVLTAACRLACGIRATPTELAWQRRAGVKPHVMLSDMGMLPATDMARVACLRYAERVRVADAHACTLEQHDAASPLFLAPLPANRSPDFTNAMLRATLPASDAWIAQVAAIRRSVRAHLGSKAPPVSRPLANSAIRAALSSARRSTWQALCPDPHLQASTSLRGRARRRAQSGPEILCPLWDILDPRVADPPCYLHSPDSAALCIMTLRSAHLPGDYCDEAQACYIGDTCGDCCDEVLTMEGQRPRRRAQVAPYSTCAPRLCGHGLRLATPPKPPAFA